MKRFLELLLKSQSSDILNLKYIVEQNGKRTKFSEISQSLHMEKVEMIFI